MKGFWAPEVPTLEQLINKMLEVYDREITVEQAKRFIRAGKPNDRSWTEDYQYTVAVVNPTNCPDRSVIQYICEEATPEMKRAMQTRLDRRRTDYLKQAWDMVDFASTS